MNYYPYLRGKQFELLAIRELSERSELSKNIVPVIEPVRDLDSGQIKRTSLSLVANGSSLILVANPSVGDLSDNTQATIDIAKLAKFLLSHDETSESAEIGVGILVDSHTPLESLLVDIRAGFGQASPLSLHLFHRARNGGVPALIDSGQFADVQSHFADSPEEIRPYRRDSKDDARYSEFSDAEKIRWRDYFAKKSRSTDYADSNEYIYTDDNIYLEDDGCSGISDFQTIGVDFQEGGGLPYAVALHLTFQKQIGNQYPVYIAHFLSDSNSDRSDPAGKFSEALTKLIRFCDEQSINNPAIQAYRTHYENGTYPGLGSLKKLSIQNHLFVMDAAIRNA